MHFTPAELRAMDFWEFQCAVSAVTIFHGGKENKPDMTDEDYAALCALGDMWSKSDNGN